MWVKTNHFIFAVIYYGHRYSCILLAFLSTNVETYTAIYTTYVAVQILTCPLSDLPHAHGVPLSSTAMENSSPVAIVAIF